MRPLINVTWISLRLILRNCSISFNHCVLFCCAVPLQHLSYITYAPIKRPQKITLHLQNVFSKISQLDKYNFKDALLNPL